MLAMEDGVGAEYTMGPAMHGKLFTDSFPSSISLSESRASKTLEGTGSGQSSSGTKLCRIFLTSVALSIGHTSFLMDAFNSISLGSIRRSLRALRRLKDFKDAFCFCSLLSVSALSSIESSLSSLSSSIPNRSVNHLDQVPITVFSCAPAPKLIFPGGMGRTLGSLTASDTGSVGISSEDSRRIA
ncbi:hypothetical protein V8G54_013090, partial [Vigna mungo]